MSGSEVLAPTAFEMILAFGWIISLILFVWAIVSLSRRRRALSTRETWLCLLAIFCFPIVGSIVWLATSRRLMRTRTGNSAPW